MMKGACAPYFYMTIIKDNELDTSAALIAHIAENIYNQDEYTYTIHNKIIDIFSTSLSNYSERVILSINCNSSENIIQIADYYGEVPLEAKYQEALIEHQERYADTFIPPPMFNPPKRFKQPLIYRYFYSEAEWFQKMTIFDNVLPYESTWDINTIRNKIIEDITFFCGGFASREEYENSYER